MARPPLNYHQLVNLVDESCKEIPGELVVEILRNLPVKSLLRFKTVCKPWKLLIDSNVFIDIHLHRKNPQIDLYSLYGPQENPGFSRSLQYWYMDLRSFYIVGACNGIVCLSTYQAYRPLLLLNPSTREVSEVYFLEGKSDTRLSCLGFCYLSKTQEYKIIAFMPADYDDVDDVDDDDYKIDMRILTLGNTTSLRDVENMIVPGFIGSDKVTFGATIFWIGVVDEGIDNDILIWFDAIEERFSKMNLPSSPSSVSRHLKVLNDSVIMFVYPSYRATFFDIWTLIDDGTNDKSWMKYRKVGPLVEIGITMMNPVDVWYGKGILCCKGVRNHSYGYMDKLFYYDLETDKVKDYEVTCPPRSLWKFVNYVGSLVSIDKLVPCRFSKKKG